ncbi:unnamed protein product, partial [Brassica rapa subsp. trilocularis]
CAKEKLSFHVLVKDLETKSPLFQTAILNPNSWSLTGLCLSRDEAGSTLKPYCEGFVFKLQQGEKFIELLTNGSKLLPSSCAYNTFRALLLIDASV